MPDLFITLGAWTIKTYTLAVALGIVVSAGFGVYRLHTIARPAHIIDVYLGGLVGGAILARAIHVLLNWNYFAYNLSEITAVSTGGLDWHGAVFGALLGMVIVARWRRIDPALAIDSLTPALALITLTAWFGCWSASCAYGVEVPSLADYPAAMVWEGPDVFGIYAPRFDTQVIGMAFSIGLLVIAGLLIVLPFFRRSRFWIVLGLMSLGMFGIGFWRGDYALYADGLRLDQWLDGVMIGVAIAVGWLQTVHRPKLSSCDHHPTLISDQDNRG